MKKIFLFMEDPSELSGFEALLRKLGFSLGATSREAQIAEMMAGFFPDLALLQGNARGAGGIKLAQKLRQAGFHGALALSWPAGGAPPASELERARIDAVLDLPIDLNRALPAIAALLGQESGALLGKYEKLLAQKSTPPAAVRPSGRAAGGARGADGRDSVWVNGAIDAHGAKGAGRPVAAGAATDAKAARAERNAGFLAGMRDVKVDGVLSRATLARAADAIGAQRGLETQEERDQARALDESKRAFTRALFQKAPARK